MMGQTLEMKSESYSIELLGPIQIQFLKASSSLSHETFLLHGYECACALINLMLLI